MIIIRDAFMRSTFVTARRIAITLLCGVLASCGEDGAAVANKKVVEYVQKYKTDFAEAEGLIAAMTSASGKVALGQQINKLLKIGEAVAEGKDLIAAVIKDYPATAAAVAFSGKKEYGGLSSVALQRLGTVGVPPAAIRRERITGFEAPALPSILIFTETLPRFLSEPMYREARKRAIECLIIGANPDTAFAFIATQRDGLDLGRMLVKNGELFRQFVKLADGRSFSEFASHQTAKTPQLDAVDKAGDAFEHAFRNNNPIYARNAMTYKKILEGCLSGS